MRYKLKIVVIGDSSVGKTSLVNMFTKSHFSPSVETTIGFDVICHTINVDDSEIILEIWDTAGQEFFLSMTKSFYKNACGAIVTYDTTNLESFSKIHKWIEELYSVTDAEILLVGTKIDMVNDIQVTSDIITEFAKNNDFMFVETSAKINYNINKCFYDLVYKILNNIDSKLLTDHPGIKILNDPTETKVVDIKSDIGNIKKSKCC